MVSVGQSILRSAAFPSVEWVLLRVSLSLRPSLKAEITSSVGANTPTPTTRPSLSRTTQWLFRCFRFTKLRIRSGLRAP